MKIFLLHAGPDMVEYLLLLSKKYLCKTSLSSVEFVLKNLCKISNSVNALLHVSWVLLHASFLVALAAMRLPTSGGFVELSYLLFTPI